jgi:hypothetical protein
VRHGRASLIVNVGELARWVTGSVWWTCPWLRRRRKVTSRPSVLSWRLVIDVIARPCVVVDIALQIGRWSADPRESLRTVPCRR